MTEISWSTIYYAPEGRPSVDAAERATLAPPAPLPGNMRPATPEDVVGRWVPTTGDPGPDGAHVVLTSDGRWSGHDGHDGCAAQVRTGRWALDGSGRVLGVENQPRDVVDLACPGASAATTVSSASRAGMDGDALVLFDRDGVELGRLALDGVPAEADPTPTTSPAAEPERRYPELVDIGPQFGRSDLVLV